MKRITTILLILCTISAFGQSDTAAVKALINSNFPDNTSNYITPARLRTVSLELMRSSANLSEENTFLESLTVEDSVKSDIGFYVWDGYAWTPITGSQDLSEVLQNGNTTGGESIYISDGDRINLSNGSSLRKGTTDMGTGGANGIALVCSINYELKWEAGRLYVMDGDGITIREVRYTFTDTPDNNDDGSLGYRVGSRWVLDDGSAFVCTDSTTSSAVWEIDGGSYWTLEDDVIVTNGYDTVSVNIALIDTMFVGSIEGNGSFVFTSQQDSLQMGIIAPYNTFGPLRVDGLIKNPTKDGDLGGFIYITETDGVGGNEQIIITTDLSNKPKLQLEKNENSFDLSSSLSKIKSDSSGFSIVKNGPVGEYGIYMDSIEAKLRIANGDLIEFSSDSISYYNTDGGAYGSGWRYTPNDFWVTYINEGMTNRSTFNFGPNSTVLTVTDSTDGNRTVGLTVENLGYLWLGEAGFDSANAWFLMYDEFVGMQGQTASIMGWNNVQLTSGAGATQSGLFTNSNGEIQLYAAQGQPAEINAGPNSELILQDSTVSVTGQLILDSYTGVEASAITPQLGMMIYVTSTNGVFNQTGFWAYDGAWVRLH
jgi:hypothetical protein